MNIGGFNLNNYVIGDAIIVGGLSVSDPIQNADLTNQLNSLYNQIIINASTITEEITDRTDADIVLQNQITTNASTITEEITDRTDADIVLQNQITTNANNIVNEIKDRTDADIVLSNSIATEANKRNDTHSSIIFPSPAIYTDQAPPAPPSATFITNGITTGWYYKKIINVAPNNKINWYFPPSTNMKISDLKGFYMSFFNGLTTFSFNLPSITLYTRLKATGNQASWYNSRSVFSITTNPTVNTFYCAHANISHALTPPHYNYTLIELIKDNFASAGTYEQTDEILAFTISTNSGSPINTVEFCMINLGIQRTNQTIEFLLQYGYDDLTIKTQITTEIKDRKDADTVLQNQLTTNTSNITTEIKDRTDADTALQNQINELSSGGEAYDDTEIKQLLADETKAREDFDNLIVNDLSTIEQKQNADYKELSDAIASNFVSNYNDHETFTSNITAETTERTNADTSLQNQITTTSTNLSTETTNRTNADTSLQNQITTIFNPTITYYQVAWKGERSVDVLSTAYVFTVYKIGSIAYIQYPDFKVTSSTTNTGTGTKAWETTTRIVPKPIAKIYFTVMAQVAGSAAHDGQVRHPFTIAFDIDGSLRLGRKLNGFTFGTSMTVVGGLFNYTVATDEWAQLGIDIDGKSLAEQSGYSVSLSDDGKIVAVGVILFSTGAVNRGAVRVYAWNGSTWIQRGNVILGQAAGNKSGFSVSLSGDGSVVAIGAPNNNTAGSNAGHTRVFEYNSSSSIWTIRSFVMNGELAGDLSGRAVSLSSDGRVVACGAPLNDGGGVDSGHVRLHIWNGSQYSQRGTDINGELAGDNSGYSVSLSADGDVVAIGAIFNDGKASNAGHVRVYDWTEEITDWVKRGNDIDGEALNDNSGYSVSLSADGNVVAIGAPFNDGNGADSGHVRVYAWSGSAWLQRGIDLDGETSFDLSGWNVSLSSDGNLLAIGATQNSDNGLHSGHVRVYYWNGTLWIRRGGDIDGEAMGDLSGHSVSLSGDGTTVAIGAYLNDDSFGDAGHVRVYKWSPIA